MDGKESLLENLDPVRVTSLSLLCGQKRLIPSCLIMSATVIVMVFIQNTSETLIHNDYNEELLERLITRQKLAKKHPTRIVC